ncbi:MAG: L-glutamate gamma-semialdehyde dehydrogenase [Gemmataceae bacterium]
MAATTLEPRIQTFGREIFARLDRSGPTPLTRSWFDEQLMGLTMGNEALKVQLFRFVDTLPYLHDPREVSRHLREYLTEARNELPWWARQGIRFIPQGGLPGEILAKLAKSNAENMARKFIAGSNVQEAIDAVRRMRAANLAFTVDLLGEATITEVEADHVQKQYLDLIAGLTREVNQWPEIPAIDRDHAGPIPRVNVSVKLSALFSQFDPIDPEGTSRSVLRRLRPILSAAKATGAFVNFDMEQHSFKDTTLRIFREVLMEPEYRDWPHVGIAIQAYLVDTERDLHELLHWAKHERKCQAWIRLVKGAYWDYETVMAAQHHWPVPVFTEKWQSDANFEKLSTFLLTNHEHLPPAFGSHNIRSISHAIATAEALAVPAGRYEFQMLYGMADPIKAALKSLGHRVRIYTPYGQLLPGMAYLVRRLLENTSNDSFLKMSFADGLSEDVLLQKPQPRRGAIVSPPQPPSETPAMTSAPTFQNEPFKDFARAENRAAMTAALLEARTELGRTYPLVIGGANISTTRFLESVNPSRHAEKLGRVGQATVQHAEQAVAAAAKAFESWRETTVATRAAVLRKSANEMRRRRWELAAWITLESGKPWREADADVAEAIDFCDYYALEMEKLEKPQHRDVPGEVNQYFYEPRGVSVVIAPWNFPLAILCGMAAAALVTGNTVILKPAEQTGIIGAKLHEIFVAAGAPAGVVNFLPGVGEEIGPTLTSHPDVALICFTGSLKVALAINAEAARTSGLGMQVKKVIAEMGGKNAIIVDSDADLDEAVKGVVDSAFGFAGQKCSAGSRAIVVGSLYEQFLNRLVEATKSVTVSPAEDPGCSLGPVIDAEARDRIRQFIQKGQTEAKLAFQYDVGPLAETGYFVGPTIFTDVKPDAAVAQEEIFGPVVSVIRAKDLEEALSIANGTKYALTGGVFSRSPENIARVKRQFRVGNLYINRKCTGALVDRQPFGGFKMSGIGSKAGGPDYLLQFVVPRTITENTLRRGFAPEVGPGD